MANQDNDYNFSPLATDSAIIGKDELLDGRYIPR